MAYSFSFPLAYRKSVVSAVLSTAAIISEPLLARQSQPEHGFVLSAKWFFAKNSPSKKVASSSNNGFFYREGNAFWEKAEDMPSSSECSPIPVAKDRNVDISYLYCSDDAIKANGEAEQITKDFSIPEGLARRVNFWRRVYSLYSIQDYVMHSSEYPEVVLEIGRYGEPASEATAMANVKKVLRNRQQHYRSLLMTMHYNRKVASFSFDPVMQRIARMAAHIDDPDKYRVLANSLRVQRGQKEFIAKGIENSSRYLPIIENEFLKQGVPVDLAKIAFVESSFNLKAVSKVGASGVYQFMPFTAKAYLKVNDHVDERRDPIKAGGAAAKLFASNFRILKNWPLAVTAYNHGPYGILRAAKKAGSSDLVYLVKNHDGGMWGFASKNFYASFLGILATLENKEKIFPGLKMERPLEYQEYRLPRSLSIAHLRKKFNLSVEEITEYNPDIDRRHVLRGGTLPRGYVLKVPADKGGEKTAENELLSDDLASNDMSYPETGHYHFINMASHRPDLVQER